MSDRKKKLRRIFFFFYGADLCLLKWCIQMPPVFGVFWEVLTVFRFSWNVDRKTTRTFRDNFYFERAITRRTRPLSVSKHSNWEIYFYFYHLRVNMYFFILKTLLGN